MLKAAVLFDNFGPYHIARLSAAAKMCDLLGVEVASRSEEYAWEPIRAGQGFRREVLMPGGTSGGLTRRELWGRLDAVLEAFGPKAVAVPGWSSNAALAALEWCRMHQVPAVLMSESQEIDEPRRRPLEWLKSRVVRGAVTALVGGASHREYLARLGMPADRIHLGYDVVDNDHFATGAEAARASGNVLRRKLSLPPDYFLASNRFLPKKNLPGLLRGFARYREIAGGSAWHLVLLGDGPLAGEVGSLIAELRLTECVHRPGFRQYAELPSYYGLAGAFVHASTSEQWGLVVNEAMAAGLPVIVSRRCGSAVELVADRENGFVFDPQDETSLANHFAAVARDASLRRAMGDASRRRISAWDPSRFACGLREACKQAVSIGPAHVGWLDRAVIGLVQRATR